jgi:hypothetical protein
VTGAELIAAERQRQIEVEGWDADHDSGHAEELALAGAAYAISEYAGRRTAPPSFWPWGLVYWKPTPDDRRRELVKAGALIAAAIDSLEAEKTSDV